MLDNLIIAINECQKELKDALVDGGVDTVHDNKIRGQIMGLEKSKAIIYQVFEEKTLNDSRLEDDDE